MHSGHEKEIGASHLRLRLIFALLQMILAARGIHSSRMS